MPQEKLAEQADLSVSFVSQIETGRKRVSLKTLYRIAEALDTTVQLLLAGEVTDNAARAAAILAECAPWEQAAILEVAEAMRDSLQKHRAVA